MCDLLAGQQVGNVVFVQLSLSPDRNESLLLPWTWPYTVRKVLHLLLLHVSGSHVVLQHTEKSRAQVFVTVKRL